MNQLSKLALNQSFNRIPDFVNGKSSIKSSAWNTFNFDFYINFSNKDKIQDLGYKIESIENHADLYNYYIVTLEALCFLLKGRSIVELDDFSWDELTALNYLDECEEWLNIDEDLIFKMPLKLLNDAIDNYTGEFYPNKLSTDLICRCFGVTSKEILNQLSKDDISSNARERLKNLTGSIFAGGACTSCNEDLEEIIVKHYPDILTARKIGDLFLLEYLRKVEDKLKLQFPESKGVVDLNEKELKIDWGAAHPGSKKAQEFEQSLNSELNSNIKIIF